MFYEALGTRKSAGIWLAVMDMWKPFRHATQAHAAQAAILFDKFHIMAHLGKALDAVRKTEYARLSGKDRRYIKGGSPRSKFVAHWVVPWPQTAGAPVCGRVGGRSDSALCNDEPKSIIMHFAPAVHIGKWAAGRDRRLKKMYGGAKLSAGLLKEAMVKKSGAISTPGDSPMGSGERAHE